MKILIKNLILLATILLISFNTYADNSSKETPFYPGATPWGIAIGVRHADIPFETATDKVNDITPLIFIDWKNAYIKGLEAGYHLQQTDTSQITLFTRFRFFDIPREYQNTIQEDSFDLGLRYRYKYQQNWLIDTELLSDGNKRSYGHIKTTYYWQNGRFELWPSAQINWHSSDYNTRYYALDLQKTNSTFNASANIEARVHLFSNLYILGKLGVNYLHDDVTSLPTIKRHSQLNSFLGISFFPTPNNRYNYQAYQQSNSGKYLRIAHGWATPSSLNKIIRFNWEKDPYNNQLTSVFYGYPLTKELFGTPIELYLHSGALLHHSSDVQKTGYEGVISLKAYYTINWPSKWRIGFAEGLSYVTSITHIEGSELIKKGYRPSKLLNYLDVSVDINIGDLTNNYSLNNLWLGLSVHHRSGIFESASQFGRIAGGSNYNSIYLQWGF